MSSIKVINEKDVEFEKTVLAKSGFNVIYLDTSGIDDLEMIYKRIIRVLPLDPPLSGNVHWDAFTDSVSGGIKNGRFVLFWTGIATVVNNNLDAYTTIIAELNSVHECLMNYKQTAALFVRVVQSNSK